jgi:16S rRNA (adenine1518-N6/adenine1519-N6)-dimethyltransferase
MDFLRQTIDLCKMYDIKPSKSKGQNFLIAEQVYNKIIEQAELKESDTVLEVGPGLGFLTFKISSKVKKVLAVELDYKLSEVLNILIKSKNVRNIKVFNEDILKAKGKNFSKLGKYKVVSNLPYNITSIFLRKMLSLENKPELIVLMLQKEVVERIIAKPPKMSLLAASVQFYSQAEKAFDVGKESFYPSPEVDSSVVVIRPEKKRLLSYDEEKRFFAILRMGFSSKRKMLKNNLSAGLKIGQDKIGSILEELGYDSRARAEQLLIDDWIKLFHLLDKA